MLIHIWYSLVSCLIAVIDSTAWCYFLVLSEDVCNVPPLFRKECGWSGITAERCEARGCCFDPSIPGTKWCFKTAERKYHHILNIHNANKYIYFLFLSNLSNKKRWIDATSPPVILSSRPCRYSINVLGVFNTTRLAIY